MKKRWVFSLFLAAITITATGCNSPTINHQIASASIQSTNKHPDGELISLRTISVPHTSQYVSTFKMMYWSHNTKTEAFLAAPKYAGMYPLFMSLHGGADTAYPVHHYSSPAGADTLEYAGSKFLTLVPEYRGYAGSDGTIPNLQGEVSDVDNAVKALASTVYSIEPNHIYLEGTSMGGAVALQLAAQRTDVRSVIVVSPFVGWNIVGPWATANRSKNTIASTMYQVMEANFGSYSNSNLKFAPVSVDYQKIHVPTLILQGTRDMHVAWQTVQLLYKDMKRTDPHVKFELSPGGNHGLKNKENLLSQATIAWYEKYGEGSNASE